MSFFPLFTAFIVMVEHLLDIRGLAPDVRMFAADCIYEQSGTGRANASTISLGGLRDNFTAPLALLMIGNLPVVFSAPQKWLFRFLIDYYGTDSPCVAISALDDITSGALAGTWLYTGGRCRRETQCCTQCSETAKHF